MYRTQKIPFLILLVFLFSCRGNTNKTQNKESCKTINVTIDKSSNIMLSNIADSLRYVPLDSKNNQRVGSVFKMIIHDHRIFMLDRDRKRFTVFNNEGKLLFQKHAFGRGPGEGISFRDFLVDTLKNYIEILDPGNKKIIRFNIKGNFLKEEKYTFYCSYFAKFGANNYAFFLNNQIYKTDRIDGAYNIIRTDSLMQIKNVEMPVAEKFKNMIVEAKNCFVNFGNGVNFALPLEYNIYHLSRDRFTTKYRISFGKFNLPDHFYDPLKNMQGVGMETEQSKILNKAVKEGYVHTLFNILENSKFLIFQFIKDADLYTTIYNKQTGHMITGRKIINDIDYGLTGEPMLLNEKNQLICLLYPHNLKNHLAAVIKKYGSNSKTLKENKDFMQLNSLAKKLDASDNPVLQIIYLTD